MAQVARSWVDASNGFLGKHGHLIHDRDPLFTKEFREVLVGGGVEPVRLPARSPNLNAYAERFIRSIRGECLSRVIPLGERHLRDLITEFTRHYHIERNHQGRGNRLLNRLGESSAERGPVRRRQSVGGMLNFYYREAA